MNHETVPQQFVDHLTLWVTLNCTDMIGRELLQCILCRCEPDISYPVGDIAIKIFLNVIHVDNRTSTGDVVREGSKLRLTHTSVVIVEFIDHRKLVSPHDEM